MTQILTHTGKRFDVFAPDTDLIDPRDIAHSLAHLCRFNGHCREFYSVAQHSCIVADLVPEEHKLDALLHDATEAYVGDMVRPLKEWMPAYQDVESLIWKHICTRFDLDAETPASVRQADMIALATERRDLMPTDSAIWDCLNGIDPMAERIRPWGAIEARTIYFQRLMDQLAIEHRRKAGASITLNKRIADPALLCNVTGVTAPVTNSLCCEAAGITKPLSATTEALIPHEKLREAALPDATLLAENCPPAQLAQGYRHPAEPGDKPQVIGKLIVLADDLVAFEIVGAQHITEGTEVIRLSDHTAYVARPGAACSWTYHEDAFLWRTGCGKDWGFTDEGPTENGMKFCHSCGGHLMVSEAEGGAA